MELDILTLAAAFGGGAFSAAIGALPSFILSGIVATAGAVASMAGGADYTAAYVAFGSFLGPHIAFAGGAAAAAFAKRRGKLESGMVIVTPLNKISDPLSYLVGGAFGVLGCLYYWLFSEVCHLGGDIDPKLYTDICALSVVAVGITARLIIGKSGLFGKYSPGEKRAFVSKGRAFWSNVIFGLALGLAVSGVGLYLQKLGVDTSSYPILCFGIAATGLVFTQMGQPYPTCHHIALPSALAALMSGSIIAGALTGVVCAVFGDFILNTFNNSHCDSHIDPPAFTLFVTTTLVYVIWA